MKKLSAVVLLVAICGFLMGPQPVQAQLVVGDFTVDGPTVELKFRPFVITFDNDTREARENLDLQFIDVVFKTNYSGEATNETSFESFEYRFDNVVRDATGNWVIPFGDKALLNEGKNVVSARGISTEGVVGQMGPDGIINYIPPTPIPSPTPVPPTPTPVPPLEPPLLILDQVNVVK